MAATPKQITPSAEHLLLLDLFLQDQATVNGPGTVNTRRTYLNQFIRVYGTMEVTTKQIRQFFDAQGLQDSTRQTYLSHYSEYYKWAIRVSAAEENPAAKLQISGKRKLPPTESFSSSDVDRWMELSKGGKYPGIGKGMIPCFIALAAYQGMKCNEISKVRAEDLNYADRTISFHTEVKWPRSNILHPKTAAVLQAVDLPDQGLLFPEAGPQRISRAVNDEIHACDSAETAESLVRWHKQQVEQFGRDFDRYPDTHGTQQALTPIEREIVAVLDKKVPGVSQNYLQSISDLDDSSRIAFRGVATELRELIREVLDKLAPDDKVEKAPGFQPEKGTTKPTQKQKARFILKDLGLGKTAMGAPESTLLVIDEHVGTFCRSIYVRSSNTLHTDADRKEVRQIKLYVDALLSELLGINRASGMK